MALIRAFIRDERGATAIEYIMIASLISIFCIVGARSIGNAISHQFIGPVGSALN
jgi:Flp pilus assembly pilin Flp